MNRTQKTLLWIVCAVLTGLSLVVLKMGGSESSRVKTYVTSLQGEGGRCVHAWFEQHGTNRYEHFVHGLGKPTVVWPGHTAVVEQAEVLLDGAPYAVISATASSVYLVATSGLFAVRSDGIEVKATALGK